MTGGLLVRLEGITQPSLESRELHNALIARQLYLGDGTHLPEAHQRVLRALEEVVQPIEPPILDLAAAAGFRLVGGEELWIPRLISSALWVLGGVFLYLIARRLATPHGAVVAVALYLFWPYGVWLSRLYMPDGFMVALLLAGALAVIRYWERRTGPRLLAAAAVSSVAAVIKPGVAFVFLVVLFAALATARSSFRDSVVRGQLPLFVVLASALAIAYYVYGAHVRGSLAAEAGGRVEPRLIGTGWFWRGWWEMVSIVLPFPQPQSYLALVPIAAALAGVVVARQRVQRAVLIGLLVGYLAFAFAVPGFTASHAYYALPLIPIFALAIGTLVGFLLERLRPLAPIACFAFAVMVSLVIGAAIFKSHAVLSGPPPFREIEDYRRVGEVTRHTTRGVVVDVRLRSPVMYWGWIVARYWYPPTPSEDLPRTGPALPARIDAESAEYLIVMEPSELDTEPRLRAFTRDLPIVERTEDFVVFDMRGGRAVAAERQSELDASG